MMGGLIALINNKLNRRDTAHDIAQVKRDADNQRRDDALGAQSQALALLVAAQKPMELTIQRLADRQDKVDLRMGTLSETTAVLAKAIESHELYHERHLDKSTQRG